MQFSRIFLISLPPNQLPDRIRNGGHLGKDFDGKMDNAPSRTLRSRCLYMASSVSAFQVLRLQALKHFQIQRHKGLFDRTQH